MLLSGPALAKLTMDEARTRFDQHLAECTKEFGYSPEQSFRFGDHELAPKELEWRKCAYEGVRKWLIPNTDLPEGYDQLIDEDQRMTSSIAAKQLTRTERRERLDQLMHAIEEKERAERERLELELEAMMKDMQELQRQMDRMNEIQRMQQHAIGRFH
jgi:hypothetical protein